MDDISSRFRELFPIILGALICLFSMFILLTVSQMIVQRLFLALGCAGLLVFEESTFALIVSLIAIVYLPSGFLGGFYVGHKMEENLRIALLFPSLIAFVILTVLRFYFGGLILSFERLGRDVLLPLLGNVAGSYLGGYTVIWGKEESIEASDER